MRDLSAIPIPAQVIATWIGDNKQFIDKDLPQRNAALEKVRQVNRPQLLAKDCIIKVDVTDCAPISLSAVDAAQVEVPIGDLVSILIQAVRVGDNGGCFFGPYSRLTCVNGHEAKLAARAMRIAAECELLQQNTDNITIADLSFVSLLMDVNLAVSFREHSGNQTARLATDRLINESLFINTIRNVNVIAMSKLGEAKTLDKNISDREAYDEILDAGEYSKPRSITEGLQREQWFLGLARRGFNDAETNEIKNIYQKRLSVIYYKPHSWSRAFRIEAYSDLLNTESKLIPLLSAIYYQTKIRNIVEPWPQFMADFTCKRLKSIGKLYGEMNRHRTKFTSARTKGNGHDW